MIYTGGTEGIVRCNHCKQVVLLEHRNAHALDCSSRKRKRKLDKVAMEREGKRLYAIAVARHLYADKYRGEMHYAHATSVADAKAQFCFAEPDRQKVRILEVGLAIGWEVDEKGEIVSSVKADNRITA